jgi:hypothetical protein
VGADVSAPVLPLGDAVMSYYIGYVLDDEQFRRLRAIREMRVTESGDRTNPTYEETAWELLEEALEDEFQRAALLPPQSGAVLVYWYEVAFKPTDWEPHWVRVCVPGPTREMAIKMAARLTGCDRDTCTYAQREPEHMLLPALATPLEDLQADVPPTDDVEGDTL